MAPRAWRRARGQALNPHEGSGSGGQLLVVSTPIGNLADCSPRAIEAFVSADLICCEDTRHTGRLLHLLGVHGGPLLSLHAHNEASRLDEVMSALEAGRCVALCSDAGTPLVSDPGARLVAAAIERGFAVRALPGASALLCALVVSGFSGRFSFEGFLPRRGPERRERLEAIAIATEITILYEAPTRLAATLGELAELCGGERAVAICRELTKLHEEVFRGSLSDAVAADLVTAPRGEFVLVLGPVPEPVAEEGSLSAALADLLSAGLSRRDAVLAVEVLLKAPHREAYSMALSLGGAVDGSSAPGGSGARPRR